jgi:hypothetical protein
LEDRNILLIFVLTKKDIMNRRTVYVTFELVIESDDIITDKVTENVVSEMDYQFSYDENGVRIMPHMTELIESSDTLN